MPKEKSLEGKTPRTFDTTGEGWPTIFGYKPISDEQAKVTGQCSPFNKIRSGDTLLVKTADGGKAALLVEEISFTNEVYDAVITLMGEPTEKA